MKSLTFRLREGELLKEEIEERTKDTSGVLLSIVGGVRNAFLRMPGSTPDNQQVEEFDGPFEIVSGTGTVSPDGCHIHMSISDKSGRVIGGHLKDGCRVYMTAEVVIGILEDASYRRVLNKETGFKELEVN